MVYFQWISRAIVNNFQILNLWSFLVHLTPFQKQKSKRRLKHVSSTEVAQSFCQDERDHPRLIKKYIIIEIGRGFVGFFYCFVNYGLIYQGAIFRIKIMSQKSIKITELFRTITDTYIYFSNFDYSWMNCFNYYSIWKQWIISISGNIN